MDYENLFLHFPALQSQLKSCFASGDHAGIVDLLTENQPLATEPYATLIRACATFAEAFEVMVDQIIPASQQALKLLDTAQAQGLDSAATAPFRREIEAVYEAELERQREDESAADTAIADRDATADQLATAAHRASAASNHEEAAAAFLRAAELETLEAAERGRWGRPDATMSYLVRVGVELASAGHFSRAFPHLRKAIDFDWKGARLWADRHTVEWAFSAILQEQAVRRDWSAFTETWAQARERCRELDWPFPGTSPVQEELLAVCVTHKLLGPLSDILAAIESRSTRLPKALRDRVDGAKKLLD